MSRMPLVLRREGGLHRVLPDTGMGLLGQPFLVGESGGRRATLETLYDYFINNVPDPDTALLQDPDFDEKLRQHPDVHACMRLRELTVASLPVTVEPSDMPGVHGGTAKRIADYVRWVLDTLPNRTEFYRQMQNAVLRGGQGHELVWANVDGASRPVEYWPVDKSRFVFDRMGNMGILTRETPVWGSYITQRPTKFPGSSEEQVWPSPPGRFLYHKYVVEGGSWSRPAAEGYVYWGRGEDTHLYIPVTFDQFVLRNRMRWLEKHGLPTSKLWYPESDGSPSSAVEAIAKSVRGEAVICLPRPANGDRDAFYDLEFEAPPGTGYDAFNNFSETWTKPRIEKIILGGANLLDVGERGSYGATVAQRDAGASIIFRFDALNIDETMNLQLIPHIVRAKWPKCPNAYMPKHRMAPEEELDQEVRLNNLRTAAEMVPIPESAVYSAAGVDKPAKNPKTGEQEKTVFLGQQASPNPFEQFMGGGGGGGAPPGNRPPGQPSPHAPPNRKRPTVPFRKPTKQ